jgi:tRNA(Ile)-lysidine synthase
VNIDIEPGTYVVAVSGGVDSIALLHALHKRPDLKLIVAHYDHGIRADSEKDRKHVQRIAKSYKLPFVFDEGHLGPDASEDTARKARYKFLNSVRASTGAKGIITAHHKDDAMETAVLHLVRGTGRRGLSALGSHKSIHRPLLHIPKFELEDYAKQNGLVWREDATNADVKYLRNYIRHRILPKLTGGQRRHLHELITKMRGINGEIDELLDIALHMQPSRHSLSRIWFVNLPHKVATEVMAYWLRRHGVLSFDKRQVEHLVIAAKTYLPNKRIDIDKTHTLKVTKDLLALLPRDR